MFKVNIKDTITTSITLLLFFYSKLEKVTQIVDFEQATTGWERDLTFQIIDNAQC